MSQIFKQPELAYEYIPAEPDVFGEIDSVINQL